MSRRKAQSNYLKFSMLHEKLTEQIIGAAIEVHRHLGAGLLESTYRAALAHEFNLRGIGFRKEVELPV